MPRRARIALAFAAGLAALAALAWLVPLSGYKAALEAEASRALGQPVRIAAMHIQLLPWPKLRLDGLAVGAEDQLAAATVTLQPELASLFAATRVIHRVEVAGLRARADFLMSLAGRPGGDGPPAVAVRAVALRGAALALAAGTLADVDADIDLDVTGAPLRVRLAADAGRLRVELSPGEAGRPLRLAARDWRLPAGPPLHFAELDAEGRLTDAGLTLTKLSGRLYGGSLAGQARLAWGGGWRAGGDITLAGVAVEPLLAVFSPAKTLGGRLDARARFETAAKDAARLAEAARVDGQFAIHEGVLHGVDLAGAARLVGAREGGGETRFDRLAGDYALRGRALRVERLQVSSGTLKAAGHLELGPARQLAGRLVVDLHAGVSLVSVPLRVSGSLHDPVVLPTGAAVAGAAAGAAVLGPGVGTSLGVRAAEAIDRLFGGGK